MNVLAHKGTPFFRVMQSKSLFRALLARFEQFCQGKDREKLGNLMGKGLGLQGGDLEIEVASEGGVLVTTGR